MPLEQREKDTSTVWEELDSNPCPIVFARDRSSLRTIASQASFSKTKNLQIFFELVRSLRTNFPIDVSEHHESFFKVQTFFA